MTEPVADGLAFSAPSVTFRRCRPGLRGVSDSATDLGRSRGPPALMTLSSPPERSCESWRRLSATPPLMRFAPSQCALPPAYLSCVHSQEPKLPSVRRCQPSNHVPPPWFRTTMTAYSTRESRVCCTPQPAKGSPRFLRPGTEPAREPSWIPLAVPATRFTPFEDFPSSAAVLTSLWPLPSCRYRPARAHTSDRSRMAHRPPPAEARDVHPVLPAPATTLPRPEGRAS
jgi:hypothetical protein